jgi:hypothetical protein
MPAAEQRGLASYDKRATQAGSDPASERRRAFACALWAARLASGQHGSHLAVKASTVLVEELTRLKPTYPVG